MITDARVFDTREFVPSQEMIVSRHDEISALSNDIEAFLDGTGNTHSLITGPTGAGKTCIARFVLEELRKQRLDTRTEHIDCWQHHSDFAFLGRLLAGVGRPVGLDERNVPHDQLLQYLREADDQPYVVVLDELDQLDNLDILHDLYNMSHVYPVMICNREEDLFTRLESRARSRWGVGRKLRCSSYSHDELVNILELRARYGLEPESVTESVLEEIADGVAGDARLAIKGLKHASRIAVEIGKDRINAELVADALTEAEDDVRQATLSSLNRDQRILYEILEEYDVPLGMGEVEGEYHSRVPEPKSTRTLRRYLKKMEHYNLIEISGENRGRTYQLR